MTDSKTVKSEPEALNDETLDQVTGGSMTLTNDADDVEVVAAGGGGGKVKVRDLMMVKHVDGARNTTLES